MSRPRTAPTELEPTPAVRTARPVNGFELACKLASNGNSPMKIPVNDVARGFDEGKQIRSWRDAIPSYAAFFKYRFK